MIGRICGTGSYIPPKILSNDDLAGMVDTNDEWIRERTGVKRRHVAKEETTSFMAAEAAKRAMENGNVVPEEIDLILVASATPDTIFPSLACLVQKEIGAVNAAGFDMQAACTGFVFGYQTAQAYIAAGIYKTVLVIGSETLSSMVDWTDRGTCILFGDGAGAVILKAEEGTAYPQAAHSDGMKGEALTCKGRFTYEFLRFLSNPEKTDALKDTYIGMDGRAVFQFAVRSVPAVIGEVLEKAKLPVEAIDWFVLHQANKRIVEAVAKRLKTNIEKFPMNLQEYGNTSSASVPILLDEMNQKGMLKRGQKIILAGFGAGLSYGASILEW
nr:beta-ketoacyl-ACP synthase III [uncultured Sellimonas sp.]